jgi:hypothetical protein
MEEERMEILLTIAITSGVLYWIFFTSRKAPEENPKSDQTILRYGTPFRVFGLLLGFIIPLPLTYIAIFHTPTPESNFHALLWIIAGFGAPGLCLLLMSWRLKVAFNSNEVTINRMIRSPATIQWNQITEVTYSSFFSWVKITDDSRRVFRVFVLMRGFPTFVETLRRSAAGSIAQDAIRDFERDLALLGSGLH